MGLEFLVASGDSLVQIAAANGETRVVIYALPDRWGGAEMLSFDVQNSKEVCTSTKVWMCIGVAIRGLSWSIVVYGGLALQIQSLKLNLCPLSVCTVFESIRLLCAQYLRNISRVRLP